MELLLPPVAEYGNRARSGPMRKPADQPLVTGKTETPPERHFRLPSIDHGEAVAARHALEELLADLRDWRGDGCRVGKITEEDKYGPLPE